MDDWTGRDGRGRGGVDGGSRSWSSVIIGFLNRSEATVTSPVGPVAPSKRKECRHFADGSEKRKEAEARTRTMDSAGGKRGNRNKEKNERRKWERGETETSIQPSLRKPAQAWGNKCSSSSSNGRNSRSASHYWNSPCPPPVKRRIKERCWYWTGSIPSAAEWVPFLVSSTTTPYDDYESKRKHPMAKESDKKTTMSGQKVTALIFQNRLQLPTQEKSREIVRIDVSEI